MIAVMAQRLVRRTCQACGRDVDVFHESLQELRLETDNVIIDSIFAGVGCEECRHTGYHGRVGLFELLAIDDQVRAQIQTRANASEIRQVAAAGGMCFLRDDGAQKIVAKKTTPEEVVRVTTSH